MSDSVDTTGTEGASAPESAHTAGLRRAVRLGASALAALAVLGAVVWFLVDALPGVWGTLMGSAVGGVFVLVTAVVVIATAKTSPQTTGVVLLGTWLLKLVVAIAVVAVLKPLDFYSKRAFAVSLVVAMVVVLASETTAVLRNKAPYVEP